MFVFNTIFNEMIKTLTNVGNSKAVILPKKLINKFKLTKVLIQETEEGILITRAKGFLTFQEKLEILKNNKSAIYAKMKLQAEDPETIAYYKSNDVSDVDLDVVEE